MKRIASICVVAIFWCATSWAQAPHTVVAPVSPIMRGMISSDGVFFEDQEVGFGGETLAYFTFQSDLYTGIRDDAAKYLTFYLKPGSLGFGVPDHFVDIVIRVGAYDHYKGPEAAYRDIRFRVLSVVSAESQEDYFADNPCRGGDFDEFYFQTANPTGCIYMPVTIELPEWVSEGTGAGTNLFTLSADGGSYIITTRYGLNNRVNNGLSIRMFPLQKLAVDAESSCDGLQATIVGSHNTEAIEGTAGPDVIVSLGYGGFVSAGGGNDIICVRGGPTIVHAGDGDDEVYGGPDTDIIIGGNGNDYIRGNGGIDAINGGAGHDVLNGGNGNDTIKGGSGNDRIDGGSGADTCDGDSGNDRIFSCGMSRNARR